MKSRCATILTRESRKVRPPSPLGVWCPRYRERVLTGRVAPRIRDLLRQIGCAGATYMFVAEVGSCSTTRSWRISSSTASRKTRRFRGGNSRETREFSANNANSMQEREAIRIVVGFQRCFMHYADFRIMPRQGTSPPSNEAFQGVHIGIIRAAPGWQTASELAGIGRCW
jgi:hypothetical protein